QKPGCRVSPDERGLKRGDPLMTLVESRERVAQPGTGARIELRRYATKIRVILGPHTLRLVEKLNFRREIREPVSGARCCIQRHADAALAAEHPGVALHLIEQ